jgi:prepilin-type N-terminal cleavage/methylation domain-containing protein
MKRRGFSLIELLMVIIIISIIMALIVPALNGGREAARGITCTNNLKEIGLALHNYQHLFERFPMGYVAAKDSNPFKAIPGWGWSAQILPHMEQMGMYRTINFARPVADVASSTATNTTLRIMICPSDTQSGEFTLRREDGKPIGLFSTSSYVGNYGSGGDIANAPGDGNGFFVRNRAFVLDEFQDGLSATFAVGERAAMLTKSTWVGVVDGGVCTITPDGPSRSRKIGRGAVQVLARVDDRPLNSPLADPDNFFSPHPRGGHFLIGDGSVRFVHQTIDQRVYRALATRNGGEMIDSEAR